MDGTARPGPLGISAGPIKPGQEDDQILATCHAGIEGFGWTYDLQIRGTLIPGDGVSYPSQAATIRAAYDHYQRLTDKAT